MLKAQNKEFYKLFYFAITEFAQKNLIKISNLSQRHYNIKKSQKRRKLIRHKNKSYMEPNPVLCAQYTSMESLSLICFFKLFWSFKWYFHFKVIRSPLVSVITCIKISFKRMKCTLFIKIAKNPNI